MSITGITRQKSTRTPSPPVFSRKAARSARNSHSGMSGKPE